MKDCILPFSKKAGLGLTKNYRGITLTSIAAKIYYALLRDPIEPKIENMASGEINPPHHKFWLSVEFLKVYAQKTERQQYYFSTLLRPLTPFRDERSSKF